MERITGEFALYKGENLLAIGTAEEIAEVVGIKRESVLFYGTKSYKKRLEEQNKINGNVKILVSLD